MERKVFEIPPAEKKAAGKSSAEKQSSEQAAKEFQQQEKLTQQQLEKEKQLQEKITQEQLEKEKQLQEKITQEQLEKEKQLQEMKKEEGRGEGGELFYVVEDMPKFQGGSHETCQEYIQEHLKYPEKARQAGIQGMVLVQFVVSAKGQVRDAEVKRGVDPLLDKAALDAVNSMPAWEPGLQRGKPVAVIFTVPVVFKADGK
jgi:TonB family protein